MAAETQDGHLFLEAASRLVVSLAITGVFYLPTGTKSMPKKALDTRNSFLYNRAVARQRGFLLNE